MLSADRDALLCDMAETYHIYDLRALPVDTLAALSFGLRENSRIKQKIFGYKYMSPERLLAHVVDRLILLPYQLFGSEEDEQPKLLTEYLYGEKNNEEPFGFASGEDFMKAWNY